MGSSRALRVLHCPYDLAGHSGTLAAAERALGLDSRCLVISSNVFEHPDHVALTRDGQGFGREELARLRLFARAATWADVVHLNAGGGITRRWAGPGSIGVGRRLPRSASALLHAYVRAAELRELPVLRRLGKAIVVSFQGDDVRQSDVISQRPISPVGHVPADYYPAGSDDRKRSVVQRIDRHANAMIATTPDLLEFLPERATFIPSPVRHTDPAPSRRVRSANGPLTVLHAPSHRGVKGTEFVVGAVEALKSEGHHIELRLIENQPNADVRRALREADIVVDQLLVGWYGVFAVEAMLAGVPVVCYLDESSGLSAVPPDMRPVPIANARPDSVRDVVLGLALDAGRREELGRAGSEWSRRWHSPARIAREHLAIYEQALRS